MEFSFLTIISPGNFPNPKSFKKGYNKPIKINKTPIMINDFWIINFVAPAKTAHRFYKTQFLKFSVEGAGWVSFTPDLPIAKRFY